MKRLFTMIAALSITLVLAVQPASAAVNFPDVAKSDRFHDEIQYLVGKKIISGYTNGTFQPKRNVTRGEAAIMIGRTLGLDGTKRDTKFKDVNKSNGASGYISAATNKGIINGYKDGTFRPGQYITRGDMAIILYRAFELSVVSHYDFSDVGTNMSAHDAIQHLAGSYITTGYTNGTFKPGDSVTREQFSAFLARGLDPVYKQRAAMSGGYAADMTKQYIYSGTDGNSSMTYEYVEKVMVGKPLGFVWVDKNLKTGKENYFVQSENKEGLSTGFPYSSYHTMIKYPVKVNESWITDVQGNEWSKITSANTTVKTAYKTFTNAVEVTTNSGEKTYHVKGVGVIKTVDKAGKTVSELKEIR